MSFTILVTGEDGDKGAYNVFVDYNEAIDHLVDRLEDPNDDVVSRVDDNFFSDSGECLEIIHININ